MKWLVPRYPKKPGTLITLGSILAQPDEPESRLNRILDSDGDGVNKLVDVDPQHVKDESIAVRRTLQSELSNEKSALLHANPPVVFGPGVRLEGKLVRSVQTTVEALNVVAKVFQPPQQQLDLYMDAAVAHPGVQYFMKKHYFSKTLYLVVGVATANKLSVKESRVRETSGLVGAGVEVAPVTAEIEVSGAKTRSTGSEFEIEEECDFAYRLRAFTCHKHRAMASDKGDTTRGTLFGSRGDTDDSDDSDDSEEGEGSDVEAAYIAKFNAFKGKGDFSGIPGLPVF